MADFLYTAIEKLSIVTNDDDPSRSEQDPQEPHPLTLELLANQIKNGQRARIIVMTGAGTSTAAGIPDFRSPKTGLYSNLKKYQLPYAEAIFDIEYFCERPEPFFTLAKELYPGRYKPTLTHFFLRLLADEGLLLRLYTQNIDMLERLAGIDDDLLIEAHGSFHSARCIDKECYMRYHHKEIQERIFADKVPRCDRCGNLVKPEIVFFGENLPARFFQHLNDDFERCDLLIVIGTSLTVHPFASLVTKTRPDVPRLLINKERCGETMRNGFDFDASQHRDLAWLGECDAGCLEFTKLLGWEEKLSRLMDRELAALGSDDQRPSVEKVEQLSDAAELLTDSSSVSDRNGGHDSDVDPELEFHKPIYAADFVEPLVSSTEKFEIE